MVNHTLNQKKTVGVIFSKDRPMQLDATLRSFYLHCEDHELIDINILYLTSKEQFNKQYKEVMTNFPKVNLIKETNFKQQIHSIIKDYDYVLFLVDDNLFVRSFSIKKILNHLIKHQDSLGYSLRLGTNTTYCYMLNSPQKLPNFVEIEKNTLKYDWTNAELDFGYPLEVSSSIYRTCDLLPLLQKNLFKNPNSLESQLAMKKRNFLETRKYLICSRYSIAFSAPINIVQNEFSENRAGQKNKFSIYELSQLFEEGYKINVEHYIGFFPNSCHEEIDIYFTK